jgi:hypothetical protein
MLLRTPTQPSSSISAEWQMLRFRIGFEGCLRSYIEYLETELAHFGDGIDFNYLRTIDRR